MIAQVRLVLRDHPTCKREMKCPGRADHGIEQPPVRLHIQKQAEHAKSGDCENAVEREKIVSERDPEIVSVRHDMSAFATNKKSADASAHQQNPKCMDKLMSDNINEDRPRQTEEGDEPQHRA